MNFFEQVEREAVYS